MSPSEIARAVRLRLAAEVIDDLAALDKLAASVAALRSPAADTRDDWMRALALAFAVERYYTAVEATLTRVLRALDGDVPSGSASHQELLRAATVAVAGARPAIVGKEALAELRELLKFRHLARHGYESEPEIGRMAEHAMRVGAAHANVGADLRALVAWLSAE